MRSSVINRPDEREMYHRTGGERERDMDAWGNEV